MEVSMPLPHHRLPITFKIRFDVFTKISDQTAYCLAFLALLSPTCHLHVLLLHCGPIPGTFRWGQHVWCAPEGLRTGTVLCLRPSLRQREPSTLFGPLSHSANSTGLSGVGRRTMFLTLNTTGSSKWDSLLKDSWHP